MKTWYYAQKVGGQPYAWRDADGQVGVTEYGAAMGFEVVDGQLWGPPAGVFADADRG